MSSVFETLRKRPLAFILILYGIYFILVGAVRVFHLQGIPLAEARYTVKIVVLLLAGKYFLGKRFGAQSSEKGESAGDEKNDREDDSRESHGVGNKQTKLE